MCIKSGSTKKRASKAKVREKKGEVREKCLHENRRKEDAEEDIDVGWRSKENRMEEDQEECQQRENKFRKKNKQLNKKLFVNTVYDD